MDLKHAYASVSGSSRRSRLDSREKSGESTRRPMCERCPSCIQIRNISEFSTERAPLLASSTTVLGDGRCYDKLLIYIFIFILLFGSGIGTYLLVLQGQETVIEEFDFVSRERWGVNNTFLKHLPPLHNPASRILLLELLDNCTDTALETCLRYEEFSDNHRKKLRIYSKEVLYNFYVDKNGKIFEGRGWTLQSDCGIGGGCDDILAIGVIEESNKPPSRTQIEKLKAFLDYSVMAHMLKPCYGKLVKHSMNGYFEKLVFTLNKLNRKDHTCIYFT